MQDGFGVCFPGISWQVFVAVAVPAAFNNFTPLAQTFLAALVDDRIALGVLENIASEPPGYLAHGRA